MFSQNQRQNVLPHPALLRAGRDANEPARPVQQQLCAGETVRMEGQPGRLRRVSEGCVVLFQLLADGRRQITDVIGPGDYFGCSGDGREPISAKALTFTRIDVIEAPVTPELTAEAAIAAVARLRRHATLLGRMSAAEKTASALLDLSKSFQRKAATQARRGRVTFSLYLTRADLADWLGLTVETVSRTLSQFKREGLIEYRHAGIVTLVRPARLAEIAGCGVADDAITAPRLFS